MAPSGRSLAATTLIGVAVLLFVPVFADAAVGFSAPGWAYSSQLQVVLDNLPLFLAVLGVAVLFAPLLRG